MITLIIFLIAVLLTAIGVIGIVLGSFFGILIQEYSPEEVSQLNGPLRLSLVFLIIGICGIIWGAIRLFS